MTVNDLIEELKKHPGHWPVMIESPDESDECGFETLHYPIGDIQAKTGKEIYGTAAIHLIADEIS